MWKRVHATSNKIKCRRAKQCVTNFGIHSRVVNKQNLFICFYSRIFLIRRSYCKHITNILDFVFFLQTGNDQTIPIAVICILKVMRDRKNVKTIFFKWNIAFNCAMANKRICVFVGRRTKSTKFVWKMVLTQRLSSLDEFSRDRFSFQRNFR